MDPHSFWIGFTLGIGAALLPALAYAQWAHDNRKVIYPYEPEWTAVADLVKPLPQFHDYYDIQADEMRDHKA